MRYQLSDYEWTAIKPMLPFHGEDSPDFFRIGSRLVVAASLPLGGFLQGDRK
jgi:hypothetical protein